MRTSNKVPVLPPSQNYESLVQNAANITHAQQFEKMLQEQLELLGINQSLFNPTHLLSWSSTPAGLRAQLESTLKADDGKKVIDLSVVVPVTVTPLEVTYELRKYEANRNTGLLKSAHGSVTYKVLGSGTVDTDKYRYVISGFAESDTAHKKASN